MEDEQKNYYKKMEDDLKYIIKTKDDLKKNI